MDRREIREVEIRSVWKLFFVFGLLGLVVGIFSLIYLQTSPAAATAPRIGFFGWLFAIILYALVFGGVLLVMGVFGSMFYNLIAKWLGGVRVNFSSVSSSEKKDEIELE